MKPRKLANKALLVPGKWNGINYPNEEILKCKDKLVTYATNPTRAVELGASRNWNSVFYDHRDVASSWIGYAENFVEKGGGIYGDLLIMDESLSQRLDWQKKTGDVKYGISPTLSFYLIPLGYQFQNPEDEEEIRRVSEVAIDRWLFGKEDDYEVQAYDIDPISWSLVIDPAQGDKTNLSRSIRETRRAILTASLSQDNPSDSSPWRLTMTTPTNPATDPQSEPDTNELLTEVTKKVDEKLGAFLETIEKKLEKLEATPASTEEPEAEPKTDDPAALKASLGVDKLEEQLDKLTKMLEAQAEPKADPDPEPAAPKADPESVEPDSLNEPAGTAQPTKANLNANTSANENTIADDTEKTVEELKAKTKKLPSRAKMALQMAFFTREEDAIREVFSEHAEAFEAVGLNLSDLVD